jgi:hypothetical protein
LLREHRLIARVTDALEVCGCQVTVGSDEDEALNDMRPVAIFFQAFGVLTHNVKKEEGHGAS